MLRNFSAQLIEKLRQYDQIAIFVHINPDFDAFSSAFSLRQWILDNFKDKTVYLMIPPEIFREEEREFFYHQEILPSPIHIKKSLGIMVDTPNTERILTQLHVHCRELIIIDHHPKVKGFAHLEFIDPTYPAVAQILAELFLMLEEEQNFIFNSRLATYLYMGIMTDTNNFMSLSMLPSTYEILSKLVYKGLNRNHIHNFLFSKPFHYKLFKSAVVRSAKLTDNGLIYCIADKELVNRYGMQDYPYVVNFLENVLNVEIWCALVYEYSTGKWKCSLRSKEMDIQPIAKLYGGGGHRNMSAVLFDSKSDFYRMILTLDEYLINSGYGNKTRGLGSWNPMLLLYKLFNSYKKL